MVEITPNFITQVKNPNKDGYNAIQLGFGTKKSVNKPQIGHGKKAGIEQPIRWFREIRMDEENPSATLGTIQPGQTINLDQVFSIGDEVKVTGISKGKGFQGGVRRHGFHGGPKTHGQSDRHRAPGSIGSGTTPGRVLKGKRMAGHMGAVQVTTRGLEVVGIDKEKGTLTIKGAVPGYIGALVTVVKLGRIKGYTPPPEEKPDEEEAVSPSADEPKEESANTSDGGTESDSSEVNAGDVEEEENAKS